MSTDDMDLPLIGRRITAETIITAVAQGAPIGPWTGYVLYTWRIYAPPDRRAKVHAFDYEDRMVCCPEIPKATLDARCRQEVDPAACRPDVVCRNCRLKVPVRPAPPDPKPLTLNDLLATEMQKNPHHTWSDDE